MLVYILCLPFIVGAQIEHQITSRRTRRNNAWLAERMAYIEEGWQ